MAWENRDDDLTPAIKSDFGSEGFYDRYARAHELVGNRYSKGALVSLVAYLLKQKEQSE